MNTSSDPTYKKQLEKQLKKEGTKEEKDLQKSIKDLARSEKDATKASKALSKAQHAFEKAEKKEHSTLQTLNKATNQHDHALADMHAAQQDAQAKTRQAAKLKETIEKKKHVVDSGVKEHEAHKEIREAKLTNLTETGHSSEVQISGGPSIN